jgi:hypothetical protein
MKRLLSRLLLAVLAALLFSSAWLAAGCAVGRTETGPGRHVVPRDLTEQQH